MEDMRVNFKQNELLFWEVIASKIMEDMRVNFKQNKPPFLGG